MNCQTLFDPPQKSFSRTAPLSALTNNMNYNATSLSPAGPSSYNYADFHALSYPHTISPVDEPSTTFMEPHSKPTPASSLSTLGMSGMFYPDTVDDYNTNIFYPDTPSSASSSSEVMTPMSSDGEMEFPAVVSGGSEGGDVDMDAYLGYDAQSVPPAFSEFLLATSKSPVDEMPVDWPQLLATLCDEHPETVQWFARIGGFQSDLDPAPQPEHDLLLQSQFSTIYPHQHYDTLSDFTTSLGNPSATPPQSHTHLASSPFPIPLHHPRPVRPIPQIPLKDLAAVALRFGKPQRNRRVSSESLTSFALLRRSEGDAGRYQRVPFAASDVNAER
jgi:hypothetical protein